jgi:uncharacterized protein (TIGR02231 family)
MLVPLAPQFLLALLCSQDPRPLASEIVEVTLYGGSASIRRRAEPSGEGKYVLAGLPASLDPDSVRVRLAGGEVAGVEVRERFQRDVPDERVKELRERVRALERELAALDDEGEVLRALLDHVQHLLRQEERAHQDEVAAARVDPEAWEANYRYLAEKLAELRRGLRELEPRREEKRRELEDQRLALGRCESAGGVPRKDVVLDLVGAGGALEVEYLVAGAGWEPYYDLRAKKDLSAVELAYRARVQQNTGEDWREAEILLSTAQPQRGAQGPEPQPIWLSLLDPKTPRSPRPDSALRELGYAGDDRRAAADAPPAETERVVFASVESEGLSVRFRLPRKETIESRPEPTTVLIGRAELALTSEHYCVPALDPTVWMRGKARNTSEWVLLPGRAAVYFGADFVGHAALEAVQPGQELELALGADPGLVVKRTQLADLREGPGVFGSRATQRGAWRIELENHGAFSRSADGTVEVIVQEVLPRPRDERIKVEIAEAKPRLAEDARWKKEREETGVLTWVVRADRGGKATIELATEVSFPEQLRLIQQ